jgi:hypothetical protein
MQCHRRGFVYPVNELTIENFPYSVLSVCVCVCICVYIYMYIVGGGIYICIFEHRL